VAAVTVIGCVQADLLMSPVTELPPGGGTLFTEHMSMRVGGAGANAALAFAEAGVGVRLLGCIGADELGDWMRSQLAPAGLDGELLVLSGEPSGLTVALESTHRDRTFLTYLGVNVSWRAEMIPADALTSDCLLLCDYFCAPGLQGDAARGILDTARLAGARTFFDTAWDPGGWRPETRAQVLALLPSVDVFLPNEAEARALADTQGDTAAAARALQDVSGGWVVVKRGAAGCLAVGPDDLELAAAAPVVEVADTTGAGDVFNAGLISALARGSDWPEALHAATELASAIIARPSHDRHRPWPAGGARAR
jgi:sugar/nucleoside kinase (ribokinase family)